MEWWAPLSLPYTRMTVPAEREREEGREREGEGWREREKERGRGGHTISTYGFISQAQTLVLSMTMGVTLSTIASRAREESSD